MGLQIILSISDQSQVQFANLAATNTLLKNTSHISELCESYEDKVVSYKNWVIQTPDGEVQFGRKDESGDWLGYGTDHIEVWGCWGEPAAKIIAAGLSSGYMVIFQQIEGNKPVLWKLEPGSVSTASAGKLHPDWKMIWPVATEAKSQEPTFELPLGVTSFKNFMIPQGYVILDHAEIDDEFDIDSDYQYTVHEAHDLDEAIAQGDDLDALVQNLWKGHVGAGLPKGYNMVGHVEPTLGDAPLDEEEVEAPPEDFTPSPPTQAGQGEYPILWKQADGSWQVMLGHGCYSKLDAQHYIKTLDPAGASFKLGKLDSEKTLWDHLAPSYGTTPEILEAAAKHASFEEKDIAVLEPAERDETVKSLLDLYAAHLESKSAPAPEAPGHSSGFAAGGMVTNNQLKLKTEAPNPEKFNQFVAFTQSLKVQNNGAAFNLMREKAKMLLGYSVHTVGRQAVKAAGIYKNWGQEAAAVSIYVKAIAAHLGQGLTVKEALQVEVDPSNTSSMTLLMGKKKVSEPEPEKVSVLEPLPESPAPDKGPDLDPPASGGTLGFLEQLTQAGTKITFVKDATDIDIDLG